MAMTTLQSIRWLRFQALPDSLPRVAEMRLRHERSSNDMPDGRPPSG